MKRILQIAVIIILLTCISGCVIKKYPVRYTIYRGDKEINFPNSKIEISLLNDTSGVFRNYLNSDRVFVQKFNYEIADSAFLLIGSLDTLNQDIISLNNNDTIIFYKRKIVYFYHGKTTYLLYFRKKTF